MLLHILKAHERQFLVRCGLFLHSPFPSSEAFRTFHKRGEILWSLLNVDLIGESLVPNTILFKLALKQQ